MLFRQITDPKLAQYAYLVGCQQTKEALIIDPERDIDRYVEIARNEGLRIIAVAETHIHADFLSGCREFAERYGVRVYLPAHTPDDWKYGWAAGYDVTFLKHGDTFRIGNIEIRAVHTPGHTPEHTSYMVTDRGSGASEPLGLATGDFVFVGDLGRPDLLESAAGIQGMMDPSARQLYRSALAFLDLPEWMMVWPGHGAGSACGKALGAVPESTVGYEKRFSPAFAAVNSGEDEFVDFILGGQPEPPPYFARMKKLNRDGPPILGAVPQPPRAAVTQLVSLIGRSDTVVLDTRRDRSAFMAGHLLGSLHAPLNRTLPTIAGSYVDPAQTIYLVIDEENVNDAVLDLIRIGYDRIAGYVTPADLAAYSRGGGRLTSTDVIGFAQLQDRLRENDLVVLDVRGASEYATGHVPDALNVAHTRILPRLSEIPRDRPVALYCESGARAGSATSLLEREGYDVILIDDRIANWLPLDRQEATPEQR